MNRKNVKIAMIEADIRSQKELAGKAKLHESTLSQILTGRVVPRAVEKFQIAHALGKDVGEVFPEDC